MSNTPQPPSNPNPDRGGGWTVGPNDPVPEPLPTKRTVGQGKLIRQGVERSVELPDVETIGGEVDQDTLNAINADTDAQMKSDRKSDASDNVKDAKNPESEAAPAAVTNEPMFCGNCGFKQGMDPFEVTDQDKEEFLISLLGDKPFEKTYTLLKGRLKVTFRTLSAADENLITEQLTREVKDRRIPTFDAMMTNSLYLSRRQNLQLAAAVLRMEPQHPVELPSISDPELAKHFPEVGGDLTNGLVWHVEQRLFYSKGRSEALYLLILRAYVNFTQIFLRLVENGNRPDFWPEIAGQA